MFKFLAIVGVVGMILFGATIVVLAQSVPSYNYVRADWVWDGETESWELPECAVSAIDLRSIRQMASPGLLTGEAIFTVDSRCVITYDHEFLGSDVSVVRDIVWDSLTVNSDPHGLTGPKPLMPDRNLNIDLYIGGELVRRERFSIESHPQVLEVLRSDYDRIKANESLAELDVHLKIAGYWQDHYGFDVRSPNQRLDGISTPETTINETWNCPDSGSSIDCDLVWDQIVSDTWTLVDNTARNAFSISIGDSAIARATSPLSTDNMYVEVSSAIASGTIRYVGAAARIEDVTPVSLYAGGRRNNASDTYVIRKWVAGTRTNIALVSLTAQGSGFVTDRFIVDGSTLTYISGGTFVLQVTDTSITGNVYAGLETNPDGTERARYDTFEAADFVPPTPTPAPTPTPGVGTVIDITPGSFTPVIWMVGFLAGLVFIGYGERNRQGTYIFVGALMLIASSVGMGIVILMVLSGLAFFPLTYRGYLLISQQTSGGGFE